MSHFWKCSFAGLLLLPLCVQGQSLYTSVSRSDTADRVWIPDKGDGTYTNPVLFADYSDPDVIRVGSDYYLTSSSFSHIPGLPVLHSRDLVNWRIIAHAVPEYPYGEFAGPQHGMGIWAPAIRYHAGTFYIYFGDPDRGVFMTKAANPAGPWEPLRLIRKVTGWIDTCPFWDDDGQLYLVHAWANSRSGIKSILAINRMNSDGTAVLDDGIIVFNGQAAHPTIEGPKLYKRNGYYYIFAPAGGVKQGWQVVLRSRNIFGPYEDRKVLEQGTTGINGPHQGAWVETQTGEHWFVHFQDQSAYGRVVHVQPMRWENDWPVIGMDHDGNGIGEPVGTYRKPEVGMMHAREAPLTGDEFSSTTPGLQWQWQANPRKEWVSLDARKGWLRFRAQRQGADAVNLWGAASLLLQKIPAPALSATTLVDCRSLGIGERAGLLIFGLDYSYLSIEKAEGRLRVSRIICHNAGEGTPETLVKSVSVPETVITLRIDLHPEKDPAGVPRVMCDFLYSADGRIFHRLGEESVAREGRWVGAKIGLFVSAKSGATPSGYADFDWFRTGRYPAKTK